MLDETETPLIGTPDGWDCTALDRLVHSSRGISYGIVQPGQHDENGVPIVRVNNLRKGHIDTTDVLKVSKEVESKYERTRLRGGEILLSLVGTLGECAIVPAELRGWNVARAIAVIPLTAGIDPRWVSYCLTSTAVQALINAWATTTVQATLNLRDVRRLPILVAPEQLRTAITNVVASLDEKIEQNRRTSAALERLARAIFRAWFVDFEPVKAKAAGATSFPPMPQPVFDATPTRLVDSELGPVPEGWAVGKLGEYCDINARSVRKREIEGEIEYVDISAVTLGRLEGVQRVLFDNAPSRARRRIQHGDTIWSCVRPNRRSYLFIHNPPNERIVSTGFAVLSPSTFGASYLYQISTQPEFVEYLVSNADGSAYPAVRPEHFARAPTLVPSRSIREAFEMLTMPMRDLVAAMDRESKSLARLRDYLLPKLLSGAVRVAGHDGRPA